MKKSRDERVISADIRTHISLLEELYQERKGMLISNHPYVHAWCACCGKYQVDCTVGEDTCSTCLHNS